MGLTLFGIPNCDTVKRARTHLDAAGVSFVFHDFRKDGLDTATAEAIVTVLGDDAINRRGTKWRSLSEEQKALADSDPAALMVAEPTIIKRPVWRMDQDGQISWTNGFKKGDEARYDSWIKA